MALLRVSKQMGLMEFYVEILHRKSATQNDKGFDAGAREKRRASESGPYIHEQKSPASEGGRYKGNG
ncbi:MAG TPA: hypothetical protein VLX60_13845 [Terriglobales bacterium]|nr:hypothetical protein [Terriglobales bacterium]